MCGFFGVARLVRPVEARGVGLKDKTFGRPFRSTVSRLLRGLFRLEGQVALTAAEQLEIDRGQQIGIDQRAVKIAMAVVDVEPAAKGVQVRLRAGKFAARHRQRVDGLAHRQLLPSEPIQFRIDEPHVERRVVDDHHGFADKGEKLVDDVGEQRLVLQKLVAQAVNLERTGLYLALGIDVEMKLRAGRCLVDDFQRADLDDPVSLRRIDAGRFGIRTISRISLSPDEGPLPGPPE